MKRHAVRAGNHLPPAGTAVTRIGALRLGALAVATALAGCAGTAGNAPPALRVEPLLRVSGTDTAAADGYRALGRQYAGEATLATGRRRLPPGRGARTRECRLVQRARPGAGEAAALPGRRGSVRARRRTGAGTRRPAEQPGLCTDPRRPAGAGQQRVQPRAAARTRSRCGTRQPEVRRRTRGGVAGTPHHGRDGRGAAKRGDAAAAHAGDECDGDADRTQPACAGGGHRVIAGADRVDDASGNGCSADRVEYASGNGCGDDRPCARTRRPAVRRAVASGHRTAGPGAARPRTAGPRADDGVGAHGRHPHRGRQRQRGHRPGPSPGPADGHAGPRPHATGQPAALRHRADHGSVPRRLRATSARDRPPAADGGRTERRPFRIER